MGRGAHTDQKYESSAPLPKRSRKPFRRFDRIQGMPEDSRNAFRSGITNDGISLPFHWTDSLFGDMRALLPLIVDHALGVLGAIAILLIGIWLSGWADRVVTRIAGRTPHFDIMLRSFFGSLARYAVLTVTVL